MPSRRGGNWARKHEREPKPITQESGPPLKPGRVDAAWVKGCRIDRTIRIPGKTYELACAMRKRAIEKANGGEDLGFSYRITFGGMVHNALKEYALNHDLMPAPAGGAT